MKEKIGHRLYESPIARDLSVSSVSGIGPLGTCGNGGAPYTQCVTGTDVGQGSCVAGPTPVPSGCSTGDLVDTQPQCKGGSSALIGCLTGSHV